MVSAQASQNYRFWLGYFEDDPAADTACDTIRMAAIDSRFSRPDWNTQLTPLILPHEQVADLSGRLGRLLHLFSSVVERLGGAQEIVAAAGFPPESAAALPLPSAGLLPCRWDLLETENGWKAVELNAAGALGGIAVDAVQTLYDNALGTTGTVRETWTSPGQVIGPAIAGLVRQTGASAVHVVLDSTTQKEYRAIGEVVARVLGSYAPAPVTLVTEADLEWAEATNAPVIAWQCCSIADRRQHPERYTRYDTLVTSGKIVQAIDPLADILASKALFALAWQSADAGGLKAAEAQLLAELTPRTTFSGDIEEPHALSDQETLVLKTALGHGGIEVQCGWELTAADWCAAVDQARRTAPRTTLIQERLTGRLRPGISMTPDGVMLFSDAPVVLGLFQERGTFAGGCTRQLPHKGGVVSVGTGAAVGVLRTIAAAQPEAV